MERLAKPRFGSACTASIPTDSRTASQTPCCGGPIPTNDVWIAASAMQHGLPVVTTDSHFSRVPQILTTLFDAKPQGPPSTGA